MYNGVYSAIEPSSAYAGSGVLVELQVPSGVQIEIIRFWMGAAENASPIDEVQEIEFYGNDAAATGGSGMTELPIQGGSDAGSAVTALTGPAIGATPTIMYRDAFHLQNGYLWLPQPEERIRVAGGAIIDNFGVSFPIAPDVSITVAWGITWGELG